MNKRWRLKSEHRTWLTLWFILFAIFPALTSYALSPNACEAFCEPISLGLYCGLLFCIFCFPACLLFALLAIIPKIRTLFVRLWIYSVAALSAVSLGIAISFFIIGSFCDTLNDRTRALVGAVDEFERKEGHPPNVLAQLVPAYLDQIPSSGLGASPTFIYEELPNSSPVRWRLKLPCPVYYLFVGSDYVREFPVHSATDKRTNNEGSWELVVGDFMD